MEKTASGAQTSAPTGCYKCGRPGHWARDCPSSTSAANADDNSSSTAFASTPTTFKTKPSASKSLSSSASVSAEKSKVKKTPRTRPKLTPEMLLSDDGLGFVLRHFPRNFKYRGRGHEVSDLGNVIGMYKEWHNHLLRYYLFEHFVYKVEQVAATKRVKTCLRELRERVANGGDPTKLHEPPYAEDFPNNEQDLSNPVEDTIFSGLGDDEANPSSANRVTTIVPEDMLNDIYEKATTETGQVLQSGVADTPNVNRSTKEQELVPDREATSSRRIQITEEQKARMEANRLKALERAAARKKSSQAA